MRTSPAARRAHAPGADLPYTIDWSDWLAKLPPGETIASDPAWTITPAGLTLIAQSHTTTSATARLEGGTAGVVYRVTCRVTSSPSAYEDERSIQIRCLER
jgi:hypothetical protein